MIGADSNLSSDAVRVWVETMDRGKVLEYLGKDVQEAIKAFQGQVGGFLPHEAVV